MTSLPETSLPQTPLPQTPLPDGLTLRTATAVDTDRIGELLVDRGEPGDALDHRLVVEDPAEGYRSCAVVVDGDRVVATACLLDETIRIGSVEVPAGQVELVATAADREGQGLASALMAWAHAESVRRGHLLGFMVGIPYFYRRFGYAYAVPQPAVRRLSSVPAGGRGDPVRAARPDDVPVLAELQRRAQRGSDVAMAHPTARLRWLTVHESTRTLVVERSGRVVASARVLPGRGVAAEVTADDDAAACDLLAAVAAHAPEEPVALVERQGTLVHRLCAPLMAPADPQAQAWYVRIPDLTGLLDRLRPELTARLVRSGLDRDVVRLSTFRRSYTLPVTGDGLGPVEVGGPCIWPPGEGAVGVAPDAVAAVLLGPLGIDGLAQVRPDVLPAPDRELYRALLPPVTSDVLTYYLPY